jgi:hypothetical protein
MDGDEIVEPHQLLMDDVPTKTTELLANNPALL